MMVDVPETVDTVVAVADNDEVGAQALAMVDMVTTKVTLCHVLFGNNLLQKYKPSSSSADSFKKCMIPRWPMEKFKFQAHSGSNFLMLQSMSSPYTTTN
jgi:hypothetical protein